MDSPAVIDWATRLIHIAAELPPLPAGTTPPTIDDPFGFFVTLIDALHRHDRPLTRNGLDAMMDELFAAPSMEPLLRSPDNFQDEFVHDHCPPTLSAHWTHIIQPAWNQHVEIWRTTQVSADERG
jgi:hypothetical protein